MVIYPLVADRLTIRPYPIPDSFCCEGELRTFDHYEEAFSDVIVF